MEEIGSVQKYLKGIFEELEKDIREDKFIKSLVGDEGQLRKLIDDQRELISEYLTNWESESFTFSERFEELYTQLEVPYTVVAWNIDRIKTGLMEKLILEGYSQDFLLKIRTYVEELIDQIAKVYIKRDSKVFNNFKSSPFANRLLYKAHRDWFTKIAECIEKEDFSQFPLISAQECKFSTYLEYPESLFVCLDANMCTYIHNLHTLIHDTANTLYAFYTKGSYYQAYRVFKDLTELVAKMLKTVSELYFLAYSDAEANFFKLAHALSSQEGYKYVSMIDIMGLRKINNTYGEKVGDRVLEEVKERIEKVVGKDVARTIFIKGITSNFFMFNMDYEEKEIRELIDTLSKELHFTTEVGSKSVEVSVGVATLELEPFTELVEADIRDILNFLKEEAKKDAAHKSISVGEKRRNEIVSWINEKYTNVQKIKTKIENGEIELVFQPIVDAKNPKTVVGLESLVRIVDGKKLVPAGVFIDLIYELDLIEKLDRQILGKLEGYKDLLSQVTRELYVNVSPRSMASKSYEEALCDFIKRMSGFNIILELTEQQMLDNVELVSRITQNGHVRIAVDDFGTGYSSLKTVAELVDNGSLKVIKIDGSLIKEVLRSHAIGKVVDIISMLSKKLDTHSVAEFVESEEELSAVKEMGVDFVQGYYIAKPMVVHDLLVWAKRAS